MAETKLVLQNYRNQNLVEGIAWIYDLAMRGEISGACFIVKHNRFKHSIGIVGGYKSDPYCALRAVKRLKKLIHTQARSLEMMAEVDHD